MCGVLCYISVTSLYDVTVFISAACLWHCIIINFCVHAHVCVGVHIYMYVCKHVEVTGLPWVFFLSIVSTLDFFQGRVSHWPEG